jgi:hypothetical protein
MKAGRAETPLTPLVCTENVNPDVFSNDECALGEILIARSRTPIVVTGE